MIIEVVKGNPKFLYYIEHQTEKMCIAAVQSDPYRLLDVRKPTMNILKESFDNGLSLNVYYGNVPKDMIVELVKEHPKYVNQINNKGILDLILKYI